MLGIKRFRGRPKVSATAAGSPVPLSLHDVLKISGFKRLWLAQLVSILGDFLAVFGVINLIAFKWHGTPLQVTNVMVAFIIPMAIVGRLAGVFVDRWNVKRTMISSCATIVQFPGTLLTSFDNSSHFLIFVDKKRRGYRISSQRCAWPLTSD